MLLLGEENIIFQFGQNTTVVSDHEYNFNFKADKNENYGILLWIFNL